MVFFEILILAAVFILSELLRPKPNFENARPSSEVNFPTAQQDRPVPIVFGTVRQRGPNVVWYGDFRLVAITEEVKTGLFSSTEIVKGYRRFVGIQMATCRGGDWPVELRRVWINEDEVFNGSIPGEGSFNINEPELFGGDEFGTGGIIGDVSWRPGTATQTVNSYLSGTGEQAVGGVTPRWSETAYATFEGGYIGNSENIAPWSFEVRRIPNGLGLTTTPPASVNSGNDANPMNVIYEILTDSEWGLGYPPGDIDTTNFTDAALTLFNEGNGFSLIVDQDTSTQDLLDELQRQIDGVVFLDHRTGKYKVNLARFDYVIGNQPLIDDPIEVSEYNSGTWEDTTNFYTVVFSDRQQDYNNQPAVAQDPANSYIQGGASVTTGTIIKAQANYPGVKSAALANQIAWRDLDGLAVPLIQATVTVDRSFWDVTPGSVVAWTDTTRELNLRAFRIKRIDYGNLQNEQINLELVEDVFQFQAGSFGNPSASSWTPPTQTAVAIPSDEQLAFEAPRKFSFNGTGTVQALIWGGGRRTSGAASLVITERNASGTPTGSFSQIGESFQFLLIGELAANLDASEGNAIPKTSLLVDATPDTQADIEAAFTDSTNTADVGVNLVNLIQIGDGASAEYALVMSAQVSGMDVQLNDVYRGVMDSGTHDHSSGDPVYLLFAGGNLGGVALPETNNVDVRLLPRTPSETLASASATTISFTMDRRARRPYPPGSVDLEGTLLKSTASLEGAGSGAEDYGLDVDFTRRDYRTAEGGDEIAALTTDAATTFGDFPSANNTTTEIEVVDDPDGSPTSLFTDTGITGTSHVPLRIEILKETGGVIPTKLRLLLRARHDDQSTSLLSRSALQHDFDVTTALTGQFEFGALDTDVTSNTYTADAAGQHDFTLSSAHTTGDVEYRIDTGGGFGSWTQLIAATNTTGNIAGVSVGDDIQVRDRSTETGPRQLDMSAPGAGTDGFAITFS